jgi:hypothetical protein
VVLGACATGGGVTANQSRFERDVGVGTAEQVYEKAMRLVTLHQFDVERETRESGLYIETRWLPRLPFEDERAMGIATAQSRLIIRANLRNTTELGELYAANLVVETRVQTRDSQEWSYAVATPRYREWAQKLADDLRRELDVGVRRFGTGF